MSLLRTLSIAPPLVSLFFFSTFVVAGVNVTAVCTSPSFSWTFNSLGQSPCVVAAHMLATCNEGSYTLPPLSTGYGYESPTRESSNGCQCSTVGYSLISACLACQELDPSSWSDWSEYVVNCADGSTLPPSQFPNPVPPEIRVPYWATLDVTNENYWNAYEPYAPADQPEFGPGAIFGPSGVYTSSPSAYSPSAYSASASSVSVSPSRAYFASASSVSVSSSRAPFASAYSANAASVSASSSSASSSRAPFASAYSANAFSSKAPFASAYPANAYSANASSVSASSSSTSSSRAPFASAYSANASSVSVSSSSVSSASAYFASTSSASTSSASAVGVSSSSTSSASASSARTSSVSVSSSSASPLSTSSTSSSTTPPTTSRPTNRARTIGIVFGSTGIVAIGVGACLYLLARRLRTQAATASLDLDASEPIPINEAVAQPPEPEPPQTTMYYNPNIPIAFPGVRPDFQLSSRVGPGRTPLEDMQTSWPNARRVSRGFPMSSFDPADLDFA